MKNLKYDQALEDARSRAKEHGWPFTHFAIAPYVGMPKSVDQATDWLSQQPKDVQAVIRNAAAMLARTMVGKS